MTRIESGGLTEGPGTERGCQAEVHKRLEVASEHVAVVGEAAGEEAKHLLASVLGGDRLLSDDGADGFGLVAEEKNRVANACKLRCQSWCTLLR